MAYDLISTLGLSGWPSILVWTSAICLLVWALGDWLISRYWKENPAYARRARSLKWAFSFLGKAALVLYGFSLWAMGVAGGNPLPALLGLSLICLVTFQSAFAPSCFVNVTVAWVLFVVYAIALGFIAQAL